MKRLDRIDINLRVSAGWLPAAAIPDREVGEKVSSIGLENENT